ncbi:tetratricopeptide repeat protein [Alphaproteobacteria bacterium]|nr:tetratricopeptide repeat protein [Alphaproteobacteria bacterium]
MLAKLSVDQALMKAKSHVKKDEVIEAKKLYQVILQAFPKNLRAQQGLIALNKTRLNNVTQSPPQEAVDQLVNLYNQGQFSVVVEQAQALTEQYPEAFIVWNILGASTTEIGMLDEAIEAFNKSISLKSDYADAYSNMGVTLQDQGKLEKAIVAHNKAISLKPNFANAYYNMGNVLKDQGKLDEAIEAYNKCISLKPHFANAYSNMGNVLRDQGKLDEAIEAYNKSISLKPDYAEAHKNLSLTLLNSGKLQEGFDEYEWRWKTKEFLSQERHFLQPSWDGKKSLNGKRILLWSEQGIGDTIMWSSCLSLVSSQAKHCILECQEKLVPLLERSFPNVEVKPENRSLDKERDDFDFHLPMGSLYKHFIHEIEKNAKVDAYLIPDPVRVNFWRKRLNSIGKGPYIGISWKSANMDMKRLPNYATISELYPVLKLPNVTYVNLQYTDFANDLTEIKKELGVTIHNFDDLDHFNNIDDVAALCAALDMVVSTKTTIPLISVGVGKLTKLANWRQSPWNNSLLNPIGSLVDIFERDTWEPWDNVFRLIAKDISKLKEINKPKGIL